MALPDSKYYAKANNKFLVRDRDVPGFGWICERQPTMDDPTAEQVHPLDYVKIENMPKWLQETLDDDDNSR